MDERWPEIEALLDRLLPLPPREQAEALDESCGGDEELHSAVAAILAADRDAESFLDEPAAEALSWSPEDASGPEVAIGQQVGPYEVRGRGGAGGMGEVFEAYDRRLDRTVALKRVRLGGVRDAALRERFRREARLAAGLEHASIVRIHDILDWRGEDWLVMQWLEGETLAERLESGPLREVESLTFASQIASALASAHDAGILHRDLKAENVLITPEGEAKLLDFGLAKRFDGSVVPSQGAVVPSQGAGSDPVGAVSSGSDLAATETAKGRSATSSSGAGADPRASAAGWEPSLTATHQVLGTVRAMSPEQARAGSLDARSDLFSFGVLLYEMVTGASPFVADSAEETVSRICSVAHEPVKTHAPSLSGGLSTLIDQLLEKDPERRPTSARDVSRALERCARLPVWRRFVAATSILIVAALGLAIWLLGQRDPPPPRYVVAVEPSLESAEVEGAELAAAGVFAATQRTLSRLKGLAVVPAARAEVETTSAAQLARALGATEAVTARIDCPSRRCELMLSRLAAEDGRVLWLGSVELPLNNLALLETAVGTRLAEAFEGFSFRRGSPTPVSHEAYAEFIRLSRSFRVLRDTPRETLARELETLRRRHPKFLEVHLLEAEVSREIFFESRDTRWLERGIDLLRRAERLAPQDRRVYTHLFDIAQEGGRWELAEEALDRLVALEPGGAAALQRQAEWLAREGQGTEALALMRRAAERRPALYHLFNLALMEYQQGEVEAARATLEELLEREPGYFKAASVLAQIELLVGSPRRAAELFEGLAAHDEDVLLRLNLGTAYLLTREVGRAEETFAGALEREPRNALLALNLADALALQNKTGEANRLYRRVLDLVEEDAALPAWQRLTVSAQASAHLGLDEDARRAIDQALAEAADNPQVAFEAALVLALLGDSEAAIRQVDRSLAMGLDERWFHLPWFGELENHEDFRRLIPRTGSLRPEGTR